jgi:hypothetical protein
VQTKRSQAQRGHMSSIMKLKWANSSPIKPWRSHGIKMLVLSLKNKIWSILNMD